MNRYTDILPYDDTRVRLRNFGDEEGGKSSHVYWKCLRSIRRLYQCQLCDVPERLVSVHVCLLTRASAIVYQPHMVYIVQTLFRLLAYHLIREMIWEQNVELVIMVANLVEKVWFWLLFFT